MKRLRNIMFAGTGSDVGKSVIAAAFCRIFRQDGYSPAPFKAQNMALNSYATPEGLEIGRAQAAQAEAAGIACHTDMNPILLKPQSDHTSQVVLNGVPIGNRDAYSYFRGEGKDFLRREACEAFDRLARRYNPIVMEGAGSISELNLRERDIVNMPMARHADADVILVGDIDRGGVFASLYGSVMLQTPEDRRRIKGIIVNKFRGDLRLFDDGRRMIEDICQVPVLGVVPFLEDVGVEDEDSVVLDKKRRNATEGKTNVAVVKLRHLSNFTDFKAIEQDSRLNVYYTTDRDELLKADIIIVPGSKSTIDDLRRLKDEGVEATIKDARKRGKTILGICGGYQMMGMGIDDPRQTEGDAVHIDGMGLLPIATVMGEKKVTCQTEFIFVDGSERMRGYEIHQGISTATDDSYHPLTIKADGQTEGCIVDSHCMGTYLHGCLDNHAFVNFLLSGVGTAGGVGVSPAPRVQGNFNAAEEIYAMRRCAGGTPTPPDVAAFCAGGMPTPPDVAAVCAGETPTPPAPTRSAGGFDYARYKEEHYDRLADHVRRHVDMAKLYEILQL